MPLTPTEIQTLITDVDQVVEDALDGKPSLAADIVTLGAAGAAALTEIGTIGANTEGIVIAAITVTVPAIFRILALARHTAKAKVKAAAIAAAIAGK